MIEEGINYTSSTIKEMTDFFETRVENLEPKEKKKLFTILNATKFEDNKQTTLHNNRPKRRLLLS